MPKGTTEYIVVYRGIEDEMLCLGIDDLQQTYRLIFLFLMADGETNLLKRSLSSLAKEFGISTQRLSKELSDFRALDFIEVYKAYPNITKNDFIIIACKQNELIHNNGVETSLDLPLASLKGGRYTSEYNIWRKKCLKRDDYTCQICGTKENLCVHHIKPYAKYPKLATNVNNGITLCKKCHIEEHRRMKDGNL